MTALRCMRRCWFVESESGPVIFVGKGAKRRARNWFGHVRHVPSSEPFFTRDTVALVEAARDH